MLFPADLILYAIILTYKKQEVLFDSYWSLSIFMPRAKPLVSGCWRIFKCIFLILRGFLINSIL